MKADEFISALADDMLRLIVADSADETDSARSFETILLNNGRSSRIWRGSAQTKGGNLKRGFGGLSRRGDFVGEE